MRALRVLLALPLLVPGAILLSVGYILVWVSGMIAGKDFLGDDGDEKLIKQIMRR